MKWRTLNNLHDSDHFPIKITYEGCISTVPTAHMHKWNINKINWNLYQECINHRLQKQGTDYIMNPDDINKEVSELETIINSITSKASEPTKASKSMKRTVS